MTFRPYDPRDDPTMAVFMQLFRKVRALYPAWRLEQDNGENGGTFVIPAGNMQCHLDFQDERQRRTLRWHGSSIAADLYLRKNQHQPHFFKFETFGRSAKGVLDLTTSAYVVGGADAIQKDLLLLLTCSLQSQYYSQSSSSSEEDEDDYEDGPILHGPMSSRAE